MLAQWIVRWEPELAQGMPAASAAWRLPLHGALADYWDAAFRALNGTQKLPLGEPCGTCGDCDDRPAQNLSAPNAASPAAAVTVADADLNTADSARFVALEAAPATYRALLMSPLATRLSRPHAITFLHAAGSEAPGSVPFLDCDVAIEYCNGENGAKSETYPAVLVRAVSVDSLLEDPELGLGGRAFWLQVSGDGARHPRRGDGTPPPRFLPQIDTEGMDPLVLQGANRTLTAGLVDVLGFEVGGCYHRWAARGGTPQTVCRAPRVVAVPLDGVVV